MWSREKEDRVYRRLHVLPGICGIVAFADGLYKNNLEFVSVGLFTSIISFAFPRLKGKIEIAFLGALKFKGELTQDPDKSDADEDD